MIGSLSLKAARSVLGGSTMLPRLTSSRGGRARLGKAVRTETTRLRDDEASEISAERRADHERCSYKDYTEGLGLFACLCVGAVRRDTSGSAGRRRRQRAGWL